MRDNFDLSHFDYILPRKLIAKEAADPRDSSRLLVLDRTTSEITDTYFRELPSFLEKGDLLVVNDTRVFPARLIGKKTTGGRAEIFLLEQLEEGVWLALVKPGKSLPPGSKVLFDDDFSATVQDIVGDGSRIVELEYKGDLWLALEKYGHTPLPVYIARPDRPDDKDRYQTIFANSPGAVAAPTAGLHFTNEIVEKLKSKGIRITNVTLHTGWGTFRSIESEDIRKHEMHREYYEINEEAAKEVNIALEQKRRIVAIGTTTVRTLESAALKGIPIKPHCDKTALYIYPGFDYKIVGAMITNFHLPKSSLLVMVCAFAGRENIFSAYEYAIKKNYRFYSYGDAMLIK